MAEPPIKFKRKYLRNIEPNSFITIIGKRGTGKTTILNNYCYENYKRIRLPVLISATADIKKDFYGIIPELFIHNEYNPDIIKYFLKDQMEVTEKIEKGECSKNIKKLGLFIMDDILGTEPCWKKDQSFQSIVFNGRNFNITNIISVQNPLAIPPNFRGNVDYVILSPITTEKGKKYIFDYIWDQSFGDYDHFKSYLDIITKQKFHYMLLDNKHTPSKIEDYVYYVKTTPTHYLPKKRIGLKFLWDLNEKYYNPKHIMAATMELLSKPTKDKKAEKKKVIERNIKLV